MKYLTHKDKLSRYFKTGDSIQCKIGDTEITDGKISFNQHDTAFICQNFNDGDKIPDRLGYTYSWYLDRDVTKIRIPSRSVDNYSII